MEALLQLRSKVGPQRCRWLLGYEGGPFPGEAADDRIKELVEPADEGLRVLLVHDRGDGLNLDVDARGLIVAQIDCAACPDRDLVRVGPEGCRGALWGKRFH